MRKFKDTKNIQRQDVLLYDKPTEYTMKGKTNFVYCKCGHSVEFWSDSTKELCTWCNNYVFKTKKDEFNYRMKERLRNARKQ